MKIFNLSRVLYVLILIGSFLFSSLKAQQPFEVASSPSSTFIQSLNGLELLWKQGGITTANITDFASDFRITSLKSPSSPPDAGATFIIATQHDDDNIFEHFRIDEQGEVGLGHKFQVPTAAVHLRHRPHVGPNTVKADGIKFENGGGNFNFWTFFVRDGDGFLELHSKVSAGSGAPIGHFDNVSGVYSALSDQRFKSDIEAITSVLDRVKELRPVSYNFSHQVDKSERHIGLIAQEVDKYFPEFVTRSKEGDRYGLNYAGMSTIAIKAIQEQQGIINEQQIEISQLREMLTKMDGRLQQLEKE